MLRPCRLRTCRACIFFSSGRRHTSWTGDWSSDVCSSDLAGLGGCPSAGPDIARDLDALASVLRIAVAQGVGFALLLRLGGGDAQSAGVFEARSRVGRFW